MHNSCQSPGSQPAQGQSPTPNAARQELTNLPTPVREKSWLGRLEGSPAVCLSVSEPDVPCGSWRQMLIHKLHSEAQWTHTSISTSPFPSCQMAVLPSGTWHSCKKASPGQSPRAVTVPCAWGWREQPGSSRHSWQLHTAQWSQICANSPPAQHCREELALDIYYDQTWGWWEPTLSLLGLNLFFQWTGLESEMLPVTQTARCLLWGGIPLETQKLNLRKWALEAQVLLQPWYWRAARTPG